jgi:uncharacterized cupin superfamily protein
MSPKSAVPALSVRFLTDMTDYAGNVWDAVPDWGGVGARRLMRSEERAGLGASLWEFQPGGSQFVYHFHHGSDELVVVLRGAPVVRLHDGDRQLLEGDVVPLPRGPSGAHQIRNETDHVVRVLIVSTNADPDVAEYPDTGKIGIITQRGDWQFHRRADAVEHAGPE